MRWRSQETVLVLLATAFFSTMVARLALSPLVPDLVETFSVSKGEIGLALTGMWGAYAVTQTPAGVLADRFGERALVLAALAIAGVGSLAVAVAPGYPAFVVAVALLGVGSGLYFPAAASLLTRLFENTGQVLGLHISGGDLGGFAAPLAAAAIATRYGFREALLLGPVVVGAAFALCLARLDAGDPLEPDRSMRSRIAPGTLGRLLSRPRVAYSTVLAAALAFTFQAVISFFPTFLIEYWAFDTATASAAFAGIFLLWIVFTPVAGRLSDAVGHDGVLAVTAIGMAVGVAIAIAAPSVPLALVGVGLLGAGMSWGGVIASRVMAALPAADRTTGYGLVRSVYILIGSLGSVVTGTLAETAGWPAAYGVLVGLLAVSALSLAANRGLGLGL